MRWRVLKAPLPLLGKELVEQAARRRTYIVRVVYAALLFTIFAIFAYGELGRSPYAAARLGRGRMMFELLVGTQFFGIVLFLPAMMSCVLTVEKERRSMELLWLTDLGPRAILSQKYLGRLIPMLTVLLLALPLLALCYALGGITTDYLLSGVYTLFLTCFQVGALALMFSAFCRTSLGAFISSYIGVSVIYLLWPLLYAMTTNFRGHGKDVGFALVPVFIFFDAGRRGLNAVCLRSVFILGSIVVFLVMARKFLVRRTFLAPRNALREAFGRLDRFFGDVNRGFGNILLLKDRGSLPGDEPVAWREITKKSLGKPVYLFRILVLLEVPILLIAALALLEGAGGWRSGGHLSVLLYVVWALAALSVSVMSANAIVAERTSQTLDVLLTTPLAGGDIVRQKLRGVRRVVLVLLIPFATLIGMKMWWAGWMHRGWYLRGSEEAHVILSLASVVVFLSLTSWFSIWVGLRMRTRFRAIVTAVIALAAWSAAPPAVYGLIEEGLGMRHFAHQLEPLFFLSPALCIVAIEEGEFVRLFGSGWIGPMAAILIGYAALVLAFRARCLRNADRYLGRARAHGRGFLYAVRRSRQPEGEGST